MKRRLPPALLLVAALAAWPLARAAQEADPSGTPALPAADPADVASIDAIVAATYASISGPAGAERDWDRFRSLFHPELGRLGAIVRRAGRAPALVGHTPQQYIASNAEFLSGHGFFEREVARRTESFAHLAHRFSTYEIRTNADDEQPFTRGINCFQLFQDGERWWILSILWEGESEGFPLPERYLEGR